MENKWCIFLIINSNMLTYVFNAAIYDNEHFTENYVTLPESIIDKKILLQDKNYWMKSGEQELNHILKSINVKKHIAKNVIIFVGDGMGMTTATAARIYKGQRYFGAMGEEHKLSFDTFPNVALVKTYNVDMQVPDSAGTATALFTGVKTRMKSIGLDVQSDPDSFETTVYNNSKLSSIMEWAQKAGKHTGFVTNTRVTHATPAALYAHINNRDWEYDTAVPEIYRNQVKDIAKQLIEEDPGRNLRVILGGGQQQLGFSQESLRMDNLNLTNKWIEQHRNRKSAFVITSKQLQDIPQNTEFLLGLFDLSHLPYELVRNKEPEGVPSLSQMTKKALEVLKQNSKGFVLVVEGGLIDQAHHKNYAQLALSETAEFDNAVYVALNETNSDDTLIMVTSDHSHTFTINGYPKRGNNILGFGNETERETMPYLTLAYGNGPGFAYHYQPSNDGVKPFWRDISRDNNIFKNIWYPHLATFYREDDTHGGEDVPIYAIGPGSHLVKGVMEQNTVAFIASYAACIGPQAYLNKNCPVFNASTNLKPLYIVIVTIPILYLNF